MSTHIKEILATFLKEKEVVVQKNASLTRAIEEVLGEELCRNAIFKGIDEDHLVFTTSSSCFSYQVNINRDMLLKKAQQLFPQLKGIKVKVQ